MKKNSEVLDYLFIILMGLIHAMDYRLFIVPNEFAPAGINGIAVMIQYKLNFSVGLMSLFVNIPLCIFAFFLIDKKFSIRTLIFCCTYSFSYLIFQKLDFLDQFCYDADNIDTIYPVMIAGILTGLVYAMLFKRFSCSGGTDIIAKYLAKKKPYLNFFWVTFTINTFVAFASFFVYAKEDQGKMIYNLKPVCLCILYCFISSFVASLILKESKSACEFLIITEHPDEIEKEIIDIMKHSATRINANGIYSGKEKTILLCVINKNQVAEFENIIKKYPGSFSIEKPVNGVLGNFDKIKKL